MTALVATTWTGAADRDWSAPAGTVDWSCTATADHAVDCVYAPAFFLASRRTDSYPAAGGDLTMGQEATPERLVESLEIATRLLVAVVHDTPGEVRAVIFRRPLLLGAPDDFLPRVALELALHAHDVQRRARRAVRAGTGDRSTAPRPHASVADVDDGVERSRRHR